ncbi:MAG: hypothetical protein HONDAALG_02909 [Gammaproteobacteria bacterium]|nr:hypothetical protein [Gammaproteobacteria bacterium]
MAQNYPNYPANYQYPEPKKSGAWKWVLITLLCVVLVSGGIGVMVISAIRAKQRAEVFMPSSEEIEARVREQIQAELERAKEEAARAAEEANRAAEDAGAAVPQPPPPPPAPGGLPAGMDRYKYPNAEVKGSSAVLGNEFARMTTSDSVSKVRDFYKKQVGDPIINNKDESDESVIFQVPGSPMIIITVNQDEEDPDKTQIVVLRSRFQIPKMN